MGGNIVGPSSNDGEGVILVAKKTVKQNWLRAKFLTYWPGHPNYTAFVHITLGIGLGILAQAYVEQGYINTIGWLMVFIGVVGHFYAFVA